MGCLQLKNAYKEQLNLKPIHSNNNNSSIGVTTFAKENFVRKNECLVTQYYELKQSLGKGFNH